MRLVRSLNARLVSSLLVLSTLSTVQGNDINHFMNKRQVGVLARSGALPQGKRSVEALARNGELPVPSNDKRDKTENFVLDEFIRELERAENLSRLRLQALAERLTDDDYEDIGKRSLASLARNSDLPQKRSVFYRSGYQIRPSHEETGLLDPEDFLGKGGVDVLTVNGGFNVADDGLASFAKHGYEDNGEEVSYIDDEYDDYVKDVGVKKHVGAARNFLSDATPAAGAGKRNLASYKNFLSNTGKRSVGSALNFGKRNVGAARNFLLSGKRNVGAARNFLLQEGKRNVGAAKNFLIKRNVGAAKDFLSGKRNLASFARDGGFTTLKYPSFKDYDLDDFFDVESAHGDQEKRNVGAFKNFGKRSAANEDSKSKPSQDKVDEKESGKKRAKRDVYLEGPTDEYPMPVMQMSRESDYEEEEEPLPDELDLKKRFLGSVASWPKEGESLAVTKRHIGALARLGWLPSFRTTRYSRSGRAISNRSIAPFRFQFEMTKATSFRSLSSRPGSIFAYPSHFPDDNQLLKPDWPNSSIGSCTSENSFRTWSSPASVETKVGLGGPRGIFRRVGRSVTNLDPPIPEPENTYR